jgi:RNA-directed DNA polymerase
MSIPKSLLGKISTRKNLEAAWQDVSRLARPFSHGASEQTIVDFRLNLKANLETIRTELLAGNYKFGAVRAFTIKKKNGKKRPLKIADIRDRVVQRAITRVLEKYLQKPFGLDNQASYAYLANRGVQSAIKRMLQLHNEGFFIILEADIVKFFDNVNVDKLLDEMIFPRLPDATLNHLIKGAFEMEISNKYELPEEDWELYPESSAGLPQGGYLSPLFSNVYLSGFDRLMLQSNYKLIRYADDFIVMCKTKLEADDAYQLAKKILEADLGLKLHERNDSDNKSKTRVINVNQTPIKFLGIEFNGVRTWPDGEKRLQFSNKLSGISSNTLNITAFLISVNHLLEGWVSAYSFTDLTDDYLHSLDQEINKVLWTTLYKFGWKLKPRFLSDEQRINSGIRLATWYLDSRRGKFKDDDKELLSKYWSVLI